MRIIDNGNIRLFNKINRKYYKKNSDKTYFVDHKNKRRVCYWFNRDWVGFTINTKEELYNPYIVNCITEKVGDEWFYENRDLLSSLISKDNPYIFKTSDKEDAPLATFISLIITNRDFYYLLNDNETGETILVPGPLAKIEVRNK